MAKATSEVKIKFADGEELTFSDVEDYGSTEDGDYYVTRYGHDAYFNGKLVKYIGRIFDLENRPAAW